MCVAVVITDDSPTKRELLCMEAHNPHGAGLAYYTPAGIRYIKGLDAVEIHSFLDYLPRPILMHFRWATHGPKTPLLAHPFPLGEAALLGRELEGYAEKVLIHNGVWHQYWRHVPDFAKPMRRLLSDTAFAAYAAEFDEEILKDVDWSTAVGKVSNGRMTVTTRGRWMEYEGNHYSNLSWCDSKGRGNKASSSSKDKESAYERWRNS